MEKTRHSPREIRALRGDLTRAEFARRLGVTPLTVYRWELPDDAPEARRPRGRVAARLAELVAASSTALARPGGDPPSPGATIAPREPKMDPAEQTALLPLLERL